MSTPWGLAQLTMMGWLSFAVLLALGALLVPRFVLPRLRSVGAERRSKLLWVLCGAPVWGGALLMGLCFLPSVLALGWPALDHCLHHSDHNLHLCVVHGLSAPLAMGAVWPMAAVMTVVAVRAMAVVVRQVRAHLFLKTLARCAQSDPDTGALFIETEEPWAFVGGLVKQRLFLSRSLQERLPAREWGLVLAHERAHQVRYDNLRRASAALLSVFHLPSVRRGLLDELELACEQASDAQAAPEKLDKLLLARELVRLGKIALNGSTPIPWATVGAAGHIAPRVEALLDPVTDGQPPKWLTLARAAGVTIALALLTEPLHHTTETLLGLFLG